MSILTNIIDFIKDSPIFIISSAVEVRDFHVDGIVVRLNSSRRWGDCDIWFNNQSQDPKFQQASRGRGGEQFIIRANGDNNGANMHRNYPKEWTHTYFWPVEEWVTMTKKMQIDRPLTGTIATYWFWKYTNSEINLINFDFYETVKVHTVRKIPQPAPVHKPWLDHTFIKTLDRINTLWT